MNLLSRLGRIALAFSVAMSSMPTVVTADIPVFRYRLNASYVEGPVIPIDDPVVPGIDPSLRIIEGGVMAGSTMVATVGDPWSAAFEAFNVNAVSSLGMFPAGLVIDVKSRTITGRPVREGTYTFSLKGYADTVTGSRVATSNTVTVEVRPSFTVSAPVVPGLMVGDPVDLHVTTSQPDKVSGYELSGSAPGWLSLSGNRITGTAPQTGEWNFFVKATNDVGKSATASITLKVHEDPLAEYGDITATLGKSVTLRPTVTGLNPSVQVVAGSLPPGLSMDENGIISGIPTTTGNYVFSVKASKGLRENTSGPFSILVQDTPLTVTAGVVDKAYVGATLTMKSQPSVTGGMPPYTWSVTGLPSGITFDSSTGALSGIPSVEGDHTVSYTVSDATRRGTGSQTLHVYDPVVSVPSARRGMVGRGISAPAGSSLTATAGNSALPVVWSLSNAPTWATISQSGLISGIPTTAGTFTFDVVAKDANGVTASAPINVTVNPELLMAAPVFGTTVVGGQIVVTNQPSATGGSGSYAWSMSGGPSWLNVSSSTGALSGTAQATGSVPFTLQVRDGDGYATTKGLTLNVTGAGGGEDGSGGDNGGIPGGGGDGSGGTGNLALSLPSIGVTVVGGNLAVTQQASVTGGVAPYSWSLSSAPGWITINSSTGALSGTPIAAGTSTFNVVVTDASGATALRSVTVKVNDPLSLTTSPLLAGIQYVGESLVVSAQPAATGGDEDYVWSVSNAPSWFHVNAASGAMSGQPTESGTWNPTVSVRDGTGRTVSAQLTLSVAERSNAFTFVPPVFPTISQVIGEPLAVTQQATASGGTAPFTWTTSGAPSWINVNGETGHISGTVEGPASFTIIASDSAGNSETANISFSAVQPLSIAAPTLADVKVNESIVTLTPATATGGQSPYAWTLTYGPAWLSINTSTGLLSGIPGISHAGNTSMTIRVLDAEGRTKSVSLPFIVYDLLALTPPDIIASVDKPIEADTVNQPVVKGGKSPYTFSFTDAPSWMSIDTVTGRLTGTPREEGTHTFTIAVTDSSPKTISVDVTFTVGVSNIPALVMNGPVLNASQTVGQGLSVTQHASASGGWGTLTWSLENAPSWLHVNPSSGLLSGTVSEAGTWDVILRVADSTGKNTSQTVHIEAEQVLAINLPSVPLYNVGDAVSLLPTATGGKSPYAWEKTSGPSWITVDPATGGLTGTAPVVSGGSNVVGLKVTDSVGRTSSRNIAIRVYDLAVTGPTLKPFYTAGSSFTTTGNPTVSGGSGSYVWSAPDKPSWLNVAPTTGALSGTIPSDALGTYSFILTVTDNGTGKMGAVTVTFTTAEPLVIATAPVFDPAYPSKPVSMSTLPVASGGIGPYTWTTTNLPGGLAIDGVTGEVSGTITSTSVTTYSVTFTVKDSEGRTASAANVSLRVYAAPLVTAPVVMASVKGQIEAMPKASASGGSGAPYTWALSNAPDWLTVDAASADLFGIPQQIGSYNATITATDAGGGPGSKTFTIDVKDTNLWSRGSNSTYSLADLGATNRLDLIPTGTTVGYGWSDVSMNMNGARACGINGGLLYCWGSNNDGSGNTVLPLAGTATVTLPTAVGTDTGWTSVQQSTNFGCGIRSGKVFCWGKNNVGQLGQGTTSTTSTVVPVQVGTESDWLKIAVGIDTACGIRSGGSMYCWGADTTGLIADGFSGTKSSPTMVTQVANTGWEDVSLWSHACAINAGKLYCWGSGSNFKLGTGSSLDNMVPTRIGTDTGWTKVSASTKTTCGVRSGLLYCWGANDYGQIGRGDSGGSASTPTPVLGGISNWTDVVANSNSTCGIAQGKLYCWGAYLYTGGSSKIPLQQGISDDWAVLTMGNNSNLITLKRLVN